MVKIEFNTEYDKEHVAAILSGDEDDINYIESLLLLGGWIESDINILIKKRNGLYQ